MKRMVLFSALGLLLLGIGFANTGHPPLRPKPSQLKLMSFNIQQPYGTNWEARRDSALLLLQQQQADVVATQEAVDFQRDFLLQSLPQYAYYGLGRDPDNKGEGCWVFYQSERFVLDSAQSGNFWLSETPEVPSTFEGAYRRICTYVHLTERSTGRAFFLFNAHYATEDHPQARMRSMQLMLHKAQTLNPKGEPVLFCGDFNSPEPDSVMQWATRQAPKQLRCVDTYRDVHPKGAAITGFGQKLDYILRLDRSALRTIDAAIVDRPTGASDHFAITARVALR